MRLFDGRNAQQVRYLGDAVEREGRTYWISQWSDEKVRVTNAASGKVVRTFYNEREAREWLNA